jgi:hypothetical protein
LCIETSPIDRPLGYATNITSFLEKRGYINYSGQKGRNTCKFIKLIINQTIISIIIYCVKGIRTRVLNRLVDQE